MLNRPLKQAAVIIALAGIVSGCGSTSAQRPGPLTPTPPPQVQAPPPQLPQLGGSGVQLPTVTVNGTQQFQVPVLGRSVLREGLIAQVQQPVLDARVSNAWRTEAGAQRAPEDYAACVVGQTSNSVRYVMVVVSGGRTAGIQTGAQARQTCTDPARVVLWESFPEAVPIN